jgi:hypothetical protein
MPIVSRCSAPGCNTLTIGPWCIAHDVERQSEPLPRGRAFVPESRPEADDGQTTSAAAVTSVGGAVARPQ